MRSYVPGIRSRVPVPGMEYWDVEQLGAPQHAIRAKNDEVGTRRNMIVDPLRP